MPIQGGSYKDFAIAGLIAAEPHHLFDGNGRGAQSPTSRPAPSTGSEPCRSGAPAVLVGRSVADLLSAALCVTIVALTGLAIGWRPATAASILAGFGVALLFGYALSWACACLGIVSQGTGVRPGLGLVILFPLAFVSNALVPATGMPAWLQAIADWNPVSAVTAAARALFGNPNPSAAGPPGPCSTRWPQPCLVDRLLAVFAPLAAHLFRRRTTG